MQCSVFGHIDRRVRSLLAVHVSSRIQPRPLDPPTVTTHQRSPSDRMRLVTEAPNYDGPHVLVIVIMTSDSRTYVPHNLKGLLFSKQDPITGVL
jgi:hypothetical protein